MIPAGVCQIAGDTKPRSHVIAHETWTPALCMLPQILKTALQSGGKYTHSVNGETETPGVKHSHQVTWLTYRWRSPNMNLGCSESLSLFFPPRKEEPRAWGQKAAVRGGPTVARFCSGHGRALTSGFWLHWLSFWSLRKDLCICCSLHLGFCLRFPAYLLPSPDSWDHISAQISPSQRAIHKHPPSPGLAITPPCFIAFITQSCYLKSPCSLKNFPMSVLFPTATAVTYSRFSMHIC